MVITNKMCTHSPLGCGLPHVHVCRAPIVTRSGLGGASAGVAARSAAAASAAASAGGGSSLTTKQSGPALDSSMMRVDSRVCSSSAYSAGRRWR